MDDLVRKPDKLVVLTEAEIVLDSYNSALQGLNGCLAMIQESMHPLGFAVFAEIKMGLDHIGHAYGLLLEHLNEETSSAKD